MQRTIWTVLSKKSENGLTFVQSNRKNT